MKKTLITLIAAVAIVAVVGVAMAAEEEESKPRVKRNANVERRVQQSEEARAEFQKKRAEGQGSTRTPRPGFGQSRGPIDREAMMKQRTKMMEQQAAKEKKTHQTFVGKLKAIKKLADKEGAKKTSASLQELIDETNKKFEDKIKAQKDRMQRYMQGGERGATMRRPREDTEARAPGKPAPKGEARTRGNRKPKEKVEKDEE